MPSLSWMEMLVVGIVALIVVGPKDLPGLFRSVGEFVGKAKGMAREFSSAMNAAADEAGVSEINKTIKAAANPQKFGMDKVRDSATSAFKPGGETEKLKEKLSDERQANKDKIDAAMTKAAEDRLAKERADVQAEEAAEADEPAVKKTAVKKKPAAKKPAAKKTAVKTAAPKTSASKKTAAKTPAPKKKAPKAADKDAT